MAYATQADMEARYDPGDLRRLTDRDGAADAIDTARLQTALDDATAEINAELQRHVPLPLDPVPQEIVLICCRLAYFNLLALRGPTDAADQLYKRAIEQLRRVGEGLRSLGDESADTAESTPGPAATESTRDFTRESLKGFV